MTTAFLSINFFRTRSFLKYKGFPTKFFGTVGKKFSTGNRKTPFICINYLGALNFLNNWRFSTQFLALWDKINRQNRDTPFIQKNLIPEYFWNTEGFAHEDFRRCETKKFNKIVIPLLSNKYFNTRTFPKHKGPPTKNFGTVRQKRSTKSWYPYYPKNFDTRTFPKHRGPLRKFPVLWDKKDRQNRDTPTTLKIFVTRNFLKHRRVRPRCFSVTWDKNFPNEKRDTRLLIPNFFSNLDIFWNTKWFRQKTFTTEKQKFFDTKSWHIPLVNQLFQNAKKVKHLKFHLRKSRYRETQKSCRKSCYPPPLLTDNRVIPLMQKIFRYPKFCHTEKGPLRSFSGKWDKK